MVSKNVTAGMDSKPDIDVFIGDKKIGTFSHHRIYLNRWLKTGKIVFTSTKYFQLIDKILSTGDAKIIDSVKITSSSGRTYTIEKFLRSMEICDEIK